MMLGHAQIYSQDLLVKDRLMFLKGELKHKLISAKYINLATNNFYYQSV